MLDSAKFLRLQERQKESGLSVKGFCSNEGIAPSCFYYWQKKIRNQVNPKRFIPLVVKSTIPEVHSQTNAYDILTMVQSVKLRCGKLDQNVNK